MQPMASQFARFRPAFCETPVRHSLSFSLSATGDSARSSPATILALSRKGGFGGPSARAGRGEDCGLGMAAGEPPAADAAVSVRAARQ